MMGNISDAEIAQFTGRSRQSIQGARVRRGVAASVTRSENYAWQPESIAMLGKRPDVDLADLLGVAVHIIRAKRRAMNIPRHTKQKRLSLPPGRA